MAQFVGMDITAVRQLATQLTHSAGEIRTLVGQLTTQLNNTHWVGPDREHFLAEWQGQHCQQLNAVVQALEEASTRANQNASQQEQASNTN